ncbi:hypothetical protein MTR_6g048190 [Medicago truncatula]|uniref:Uncharacterized protein n=1 Tax=Medicago truncatula TaxID=3880 RepID=A0A072U9Y2_MEDTR|nr:hypothetical protein MTR_6g048190 [Medicago truncatula]
MLKHNCKRLPMLIKTIMRLLMLKHNYYTSDEVVGTLLTYFGLYLLWLTTPVDRTAIHTCGVLLIQRFGKAPPDSMAIIH